MIGYALPEPDWRVLIGNKLRKERKRLGWSQAECARKLGICRMTQSKYERGERTPDAIYLRKFLLEGGDVIFILIGQTMEELSCFKYRAGIWVKP